MRDPYLYEDADVLRNLLGIRKSTILTGAEADITAIRLLSVDSAVAPLPFCFERLLAIHRHVFGDIYDWAGQIRTIQIVKGERVLGGDTIHYSLPENIERDCVLAIQKLNNMDWTTLDAHEIAVPFSKLVAELWRVHPFREGNTRTVISFAVQFAEAHGFKMDKTLLKDSAGYVRDALVKASDGEYAEYEYLMRIFEDAILRG